MPEGAVVLLSGGQDSTTCLMLAMQRYGDLNVWPVQFDYGQSHRVELHQARAICEKLGAKVPACFSAHALQALGGGALTNDGITISSDARGTGNVYAAERGLPSTVVPGRNVLFLSIAAAYGARLGVYSLWTGGCLADYEGYPDCRPEFYESMQETLRRALLVPELEIVTPLTTVSKGQTFAIADELGHLDLLINMTHTCYRGVHDEAHHYSWGYGCGECPACQTRKEGWDDYLANYAAPRQRV